jgi:DNA (cytosine-5)-methyltransferase 1
MAGNQVTAAYYNDNDPFAAEWLRNLIAAEALPGGRVDDRSILDVAPADLRSFRQCHFFAGIGGWPYALALADWPAWREAWTASCPCQPLSSAGQRRGHADERHLWPAFYRLVAECRPATIFGEQVASKDGREWLAGIRADLESLGYAVGAADLPAASVGAPHIRQRFFWLADAASARRAPARGGEQTESERRGGLLGVGCEAGGLADAAAFGQRAARGHDGVWIAERCSTGGLGDADGARLPAPERPQLRRAGRRGEGRAIGEPGRPNGGLGKPASARRGKQPGRATVAGRGAAIEPRRPGDGRGHWSDAEWFACLDGKARRIEPAVFPLADGVPGRVGMLRAAGNAIIPQVAAEFIRASLEALDGAT